MRVIHYSARRHADQQHLEGPSVHTLRVLTTHPRFGVSTANKVHHPFVSHFDEADTHSFRFYLPSITTGTLSSEGNVYRFAKMNATEGQTNHHGANALLRPPRQSTLARSRSITSSIASIREDISSSKKWRHKWRHMLGIVLLLATVFLWTASNFLASVRLWLIRQVMNDR